jgi:hypothetical protein
MRDPYPNNPEYSEKYTQLQRRTYRYLNKEKPDINKAERFAENISRLEGTYIGLETVIKSAEDNIKRFSKTAGQETTIENIDFLNGKTIYDALISAESIEQLSSLSKYALLIGKARKKMNDKDELEFEPGVVLTEEQALIAGSLIFYMVEAQMFLKYPSEFEKKYNKNKREKIINTWSSYSTIIYHVEKVQKIFEKAFWATQPAEK